MLTSIFFLLNTAYHCEPSYTANSYLAGHKVCVFISGDTSHTDVAVTLLYHISIFLEHGLEELWMRPGLEIPPDMYHFLLCSSVSVISCVQCCQLCTALQAVTLPAFLAQRRQSQKSTWNTLENDLPFLLSQLAGHNIIRWRYWHAEVIQKVFVISEQKFSTTANAALFTPCLQPARYSNLTEIVHSTVHIQTCMFFSTTLTLNMLKQLSLHSQKIWLWTSLGEIQASIIMENIWW